MKVRYDTINKLFFSSVNFAAMGYLIKNHFNVLEKVK